MLETLDRERMASSGVEKALHDTMQHALDVVDKVKVKVLSPPLRGLPSHSLEDGEDISLTTGEKQVARRSLGPWIGLTCCLVLLAAVVGAIVGVLAAHWNMAGVERLVSMVPFVSLPNAPLNFLVVGDWGRDGMFNQTLNAQAMGVVGSQLQPDFIISTGDNFYNRGLQNTSDLQFATSFSNIYTHPSLRRQWFSVLGNHDYITNPDAELETALKQRDGRWHCEKNYRRKFQACPKYKQQSGEHCEHTVELFFVDTSPLLAEYWDPVGREPLNFTAMGGQDEAQSHILQVLKDGLESSDATWKVVVGHHPVYSTGEHGSLPDVEKYFVNIFKEFNVDLYLNGHDHNLELVRVPDLRTVFVTSGAGSQTRSGRVGQVPGESLFYFELQGFVSVSVSGPTMDLRFHDASASVLYNVTLVKE